MKILGYKVLVKKHERKEKTESGLYLGESNQPPFDRGEIISIGQDKDVNNKILVNVGDEVMFPKNAGMKLEDGNFLLPYDILLGVYERSI